MIVGLFRHFFRVVPIDFVRSFGAADNVAVVDGAYHPLVVASSNIVDLERCGEELRRAQTLQVGCNAHPFVAESLLLEAELCRRRGGTGADARANAALSRAAKIARSLGVGSTIRRALCARCPACRGAPATRAD